MTGNPQVISWPVRLVPNALVVTDRSLTRSFPGLIRMMPNRITVEWPGAIAGAQPLNSNLSRSDSRHYFGLADSGVRSGVYSIGREPLIRISTSLRALCGQSGPDATLETPISARSRSNGSRSVRMSPLSIARFTSASIAPVT